MKKERYTTKWVFNDLELEDFIKKLPKRDKIISVSFSEGDYFILIENTRFN